MQVLYHDEPTKILIQTTKYAVKEFMCQNKKKQVVKEKTSFILYNSDRYLFVKKDRLKKFCSLTFTEIILKRT